MQCPQASRFESGEEYFYGDLVLKRKQCAYRVEQDQNFVSVFASVLCLLDHCLQTGQVPHIIFDETSFSARKWETLFEPIDLYPDEETGIDGSEYFHPPYPALVGRVFPSSEEQRIYVNRLFRYLKIREEIREEAKREMPLPPRFIGCYADFTTALKGWESALNNKKLEDPIILDYVFGIRNYQEKHPRAKVLLATDSSELKNALTRFEFLNIGLLVDEDNPELILKSMIRMTDAQYFVCSYSEYSAIVLSMNPKLVHYNVSYWMNMS